MDANHSPPPVRIKRQSEGNPNPPGSIQGLGPGPRSRASIPARGWDHEPPRSPPTSAGVGLFQKGLAPPVGVPCPLAEVQR